MAADMGVGLLQGVYETQRSCLGVLSQVVREHIVEILPGLFLRKNGLGAHGWRRALVDALAAPRRAAHPLPQILEVAFAHWLGGCGRHACQQQAAQLLPILVTADEFAHVLAAGPITELADLLIHKGLQVSGKEMFIVLMTQA